MAEFDTRSTLIERVRDPSDKEGWREFVELYEPLLVRFVRSQGTPPSDTQDIVQEIFASLLKSLPEFELNRARGRFRTWLWTVSRNVIVGWARRKRRDQKALHAWHERLVNLEDSQDSREQWNAAHKQRVMEFALLKVQRRTQEKTWACFRQHVQQGRPAAEVAREFDLTVNAVYVNASRVLNRVRRVCAEYYETLDDD